MIEGEDLCEMHVSGLYTESIQEIANELCCHNLQLYTNHKRALVTRQKYTADQISKLKKTLYHNLFLGLHSPYIQQSISDFHVTVDNTTYSDNVYSKLAECIFNIQMTHGQVLAADKLQKCGDTLKGYNSEAVDSMLKIILNISNYYSTPSEDMFHNSEVVDASKYFQFDQKAFNLAGVLQTCSWNNDFEVSESSVFSATPGSHSSGGVPSWMKQKRRHVPSYDLKSELTLFGGLTNSITTSLDVILSLPDLPMDFNQRTFISPQTAPNEISVDEGFHELSDFSSSAHSSTNIETKTITIWDDLGIWDDALSLEKPKTLSWEREGSYDRRLDSLYFCQLGKQGFDCMYNVRLLEVTHITGEPLKVLYVNEKQMFADTLYALIGVPSQTYTFCSKSCSMKPALNIQSPGLGIESLYEFMCRFARVGTCYRQLCKFCEHHSDKPFSSIGGGLILNSFIGAIKEILHSYRSAYFVILNFIDLTLLELWQLFEMFAKQLKFLADICLCSEAFNKHDQENLPRPKFPMGAKLLSYIYSLAVRNSSTEQYPLLLYIFKCISVPYIRFLTDWLFEGVSNDPYHEFFVHTDLQYLRSRDRHFWTQGFQLKHKTGSIPLFLEDLSDNIFACGKAINLLKVTNSQHYLFGGSVKPPPIDITFSSARFDSIEAKCKEYIKGVKKCGEELKAKKEKQKLESQKLLKEKLQKERLAVESEIKRIEELELKVKVAIKQKKKDTLDDLKEQLEEAISARKEKRGQQSEEDKQWIEEMKKEEDKKDTIKQSAREELILYYEGLSRKADQREEHARWIIERYELYDKRREFLRQEDEKINNEHDNFVNASLKISESKDDDFGTVYAEDYGNIHAVDTLVDAQVDNLVQLMNAEGNASLGDPAAANNDDGEKDNRVVSVDSPTVSVEMGSPNLGEGVEDALIDLSTPQSVHQETSSNVVNIKRRNDQTKSVAKSLLYPTCDNSLLNKPNDVIECNERVEINTDFTFKTDGIERIDCKGSSAKEAMYPECIKSDIIPVDLVTVNGAETRELLDPVALEEIGIFLDDDETLDTINKADIAGATMDGHTEPFLFPETFTKSTASHNQGLDNNMDSHMSSDKEGTETNKSTPVQESRNGVDSGLAEDAIEVKNIEGFETKSLLYPGEDNDFLGNINTMPTKEPYRSLGNETKDLLYPKWSNGSDTSRLGRDEIFQSKPLLSPDRDVNIPLSVTNNGDDKGEVQKVDDIVTNSLADVVANGDQETSEDVECNSEKLNVSKEFEGSSMQSIMYPSENLESNTDIHVKEFERPSTMQSIIYPSEDAENNSLNHNVKEFERPSTLQSIIYPSEDTNLERHVVKEFERPSTLQSVIYPSGGTERNTEIHVKEFERPSTMQSIIYPSENSEISIEKGLYREYEPPTRIKELIYPQNDDDEVQAIDKFKELTLEDTWTDYIPEPYIDEYSMLDMDPQSYYFPEIKNATGNIFNNIQIDKDADLVKKLPLETIIKRSLTIPIQAQVSLVNNAIVKHFLEDLKIEDHFDAFRKFILLEDGEFGLSLCQSLFEKVALGMKPQKFCSSMSFTNIIPEALNMSLYASMTDYTRQLKFFLKWIPEVFNPSDVAALDFLELRYRVPWPCNIIITENSITKYNKVFSFLLRLKKASWSLQNVWLNLKRAGSDRKAAVSPQIRQIHLFRHEMQHFVNNLERYIVNQIIHVSWREFHHDLRHVQSLDSLHKCHHHYLDKIIFRSLLSKNAIPVYNLINKMFGIIATFESRLLSQPWESDNECGFVQHPLFGMLKDGHCTFHRCTGFLFSVISNLVKRGYQDHLDDLLLQVNFNTYYNTASKK